MDTGNKPVLSRRTALRGAAIGAAVAWVTPAVQVVSMTTAHAASAPPGSVRPGGSKQSPPRGRGNNRGKPGGPQQKPRGPGQKKSPPKFGSSR